MVELGATVEGEPPFTGQVVQVLSTTLYVTKIYFQI